MKKKKKKLKKGEEIKNKETGVKLTDEELEQVNAGMKPNVAGGIAMAVAAGTLITTIN